MPEIDDQGGRRDYDPDHPLISLMEQRLLRAFEQGLADTRHMMRGEIASLAAGVASATSKSTEEHAQVQIALERMRSDIAELRPLKQTVAELKSHDDAEVASNAATDRLRRDMRNGLIAVSGLVVTATGVLFAALS